MGLAESGSFLDLTLTHTGECFREQANHADVAGSHTARGGLGEQIVANEHGERISNSSKECLIAATKSGLIHHVIMHETRGVE
jgi:hypothetical protein